MLCLDDFIHCSYTYVCCRMHQHMHTHIRTQHTHTHTQHMHLQSYSDFNQFICLSSYEFAGRSTLDNSDIDLSKFGSLPKGPPPPKPVRGSSISPGLTSPTATKPPDSATAEPSFPRQQSQTAANLAELDDLLNTLNQHQQKFLSDGKLSYLRVFYEMPCVFMKPLPEI